MIANLQLLRFFAALAIVLLHSFAGLERLGFESAFGDWVSATAASGVDVFFVISGFVIHRSFRNKQATIRIFVLQRLTRLVPLYWTATITMAVIIWTVHEFGSRSNEVPPSWKYLATSLSFTSQLFSGDHPVLRPGWSLEFELVFYLIFAGTMVAKKNLQTLSLVIALTAWAVMIQQPFVLEFALGVCASLLSALQSRQMLSGFIAALGFGLLLFSFAWIELDVFWKWGVPGALVVAGLANTSQVKSKVWMYLGRISFPLYLFHLVAIAILQFPFLYLNLNLGFGWLAILVYVLGSFGLSAFADRFIDRPIQARIQESRVQRL